MKTQHSNEIKRLNFLLGETDKAYHDASVKLGVSDSAMMILYALCSSGGSCALQNICRLTGLCKQTINSALRKLEKEGIVVLSQSNLKSKNITLTEKGREYAKKTAVQIINCEDEIFDEWPKEDVEKYIELTEKYLISFQDKTRNI